MNTNTEPSRLGRPALALPVLLAFSAGFVDTLGFVALFSFFTAHVTGNFVVLGAALIQPHHGVVAKLLALPTFIAGVAATRIYERTLVHRGLNVAPRLMLAEFFSLAAFVALAVLATPVVDGDAPTAIAAALAGVVAMSVQNAASRTVFASLSPTTVMTGNVTQLIIDTVDLAAGVAADASAAIQARMHRLWPPLVSFAGGAAAGAVGFGKFGFGALALPTALVLYLAIHTRRRANP